MYTGGQKFGILTLISLSLKSKYKMKLKTYVNMEKLLCIISISDETGYGARKNDGNEMLCICMTISL